MKTAAGVALFDTAIGRCGIAWSARGIAGVQLPESTDAETLGRLRRHLPRAAEAPPPPDVASAIGALRGLLSGDAAAARALATIALDYGKLPDLVRRAYEHLRTVGPGETTTYGAIAKRLGEAGAAQAIGQAMAKNPFVLIVPCHRVLASDGGLGGFSGPGGVAQKRQLLEIEDAAVAAQRTLF